VDRRLMMPHFAAPVAGPVRALRARYVFPVAGPPLRDGLVVLSLDGNEIREVRSAAGTDRTADVLDLGNAALLPALVNVHTHLEFTGLATPLGPTQPFAEWIRQVVKFRRGRTELVETTVRAGLAESAAAGSGLLGEIATLGWSPAPWDDSFPRDTVSAAQPNSAAQPIVDALIFFELLALAPERIDEQLAHATSHLDRFAQAAAQAAALLAAQPRWRPGLSPHAPYSVHPELFRRIVALAALRNVPVAMHLAETREELELLATGTGPIRHLLDEYSVWRDGILPLDSRPLDYLQVLAEAPQALVIHGNFINDLEIQFLVSQRDRMTLVYCPRTHAYFGHPPHPFAKVLAAGGSVALGTDSRASNPDLSLFAELQFLAQRDLVPRSTLLELGTIRGAQALGRGHDLGQLAPGRTAALAAIALPDRDPADPYELLFDPSARPLGRVWHGDWQPATVRETASPGPARESVHG